MTNEYNKDHEAHLESDEIEANDKRYENSISNTSALVEPFCIFCKSDKAKLLLMVDGADLVCSDCADTHDEYGDKL